jgi:hypothetical protein
MSSIHNEMRSWRAHLRKCRLSKRKAKANLKPEWNWMLDPVNQEEE